MGNHRIKYTARDGWDGTPSLITIDLGVAPRFESFTMAAESSLSIVITPGRDYRTSSRDAWFEYSFEMRGLADDSALYRQIVGFLSEADAGVTFEFAYDDAKTYSSTLSAGENETRTLMNVTLTPAGVVAVGDWMILQAAWRRAVFTMQKVTVVAASSLSFEDELGWFMDAGSTVRHRGFVPMATLLAHRLRRRRGGQGVGLSDLTLTFREIV